jgi:hypothetical protein
MRWILTGLTAVCVIVLGASSAHAACPTLPYTLANGDPADAYKVMQDLNCLALTQGSTIDNLTLAGNTTLPGAGIFTSAGKLGIGTVSPSAPLHVETTAAGAQTLLSLVSPNAVGNNPRLEFAVNAGGPISPIARVGTDAQFGAYSLTFSTLNFFGDGLAERARIDKSGNLGIGTTTPGYKLSIDAGATPGNSQLKISSAGLGGISALTYAPDNELIGFDVDYTGYDFIARNSTVAGLYKVAGKLIIRGSGSNTVGGSATLNNLLTVDLANGHVGVGTASPGQALEVTGTIRQSGCTTAGTLSANTSGDIICTSDSRLKNILGDYSGGLNELTRITPQRFTYKPTKSNPVETFVHAGFIAQDVMAAIPEASAKQRDGYYSLDTTAVLAAAVNAIKQLKAANDQQAAEIRSLRKRQVAQDQGQGALRAELRRVTALLVSNNRKVVVAMGR